MVVLAVVVVLVGVAAALVRRMIVPGFSFSQVAFSFYCHEMEA